MRARLSLRTRFSSLVVEARCMCWMLDNEMPLAPASCDPYRFGFWLSNPSAAEDGAMPIRNPGIADITEQGSTTTGPVVVEVEPGSAVLLGIAAAVPDMGCLGSSRIRKGWLCAFCTSQRRAGSSCSKPLRRSKKHSTSSIDSLQPWRVPSTCDMSSKWFMPKSVRLSLPSSGVSGWFSRYCSNSFS
jgi:hypothetical protein